MDEGTYQFTIRVLERENEQLRSALKDAHRLFGQHTRHWDSSGRSGLGCPVCIEQRELKEAQQELLKDKE